MLFIQSRPNYLTKPLWPLFLILFRSIFIITGLLKAYLKNIENQGSSLV